MTYDQILTLEAVVEAGSFKAAAERLHKSQPSLSVAIKKLEEEFGIKLFDRSQYRPQLTPEGSLFYARAKKALYFMQKLEQFGEELGMGTEAEIRLNIEVISPLEQILGELKDFFELYKSTNLVLQVDSLLGTMEKVESGEADLGITPLFKINKKLQCKYFSTTKMIPVCHPNFIKEQISLEQLSNYPQVILQGSGEQRDISFGVVEDARSWKVSELSTKHMIISKGLGWGKLPEHLITEQLLNKDLIPLPCADVLVDSVKLYLVRLKTASMGPITKKLWESLLQKES